MREALTLACCAGIAVVLAAPVARAAPGSAKSKNEKQKSGKASTSGNNAGASTPQQPPFSTELRCRTAYCWGGNNQREFGIEPVVDLPFGIAWAGGGGAVASYINSHSFRMDFAGGVRFWFAYDDISLMVFIARPILQQSDTIRLTGSPFRHSAASISQPYPSIGIGFGKDMLEVGISYDELRNGSTSSTQDPNYPPNSVISSALVFSLSVSPFTTIRDVAGK